MEHELSEAERELLAMTLSHTSLGNHKAQSAMGWDADTYEQVKQGLVAKGLLVSGRGRGGSIKATGLADMNMAYAIDFNFGKEPANSFTNEAPALVRTMMANPPFNVKGACPGLDPGWWDARLEGDGTKVWACPLAKPRGRAFRYTPRPDYRPAGCRSNRSREMRAKPATFSPE